MNDGFLDLDFFLGDFFMDLLDSLIVFTRKLFEELMRDFK